MIQRILEVIWRVLEVIRRVLEVIQRVLESDAVRPGSDSAHLKRIRRVQFIQRLISIWNLLLESEIVSPAKRNFKTFTSSLVPKDPDTWSRIRPH